MSAAPFASVCRLTVAESVEVSGPAGQGWHVEVVTDTPGTFASVEVRGGFNGGYLVNASSASVATTQGPSVVRLVLQPGGPASVRVRMERY